MSPTLRAVANLLFVGVISLITGFISYKLAGDDDLGRLFFTAWLITLVSWSIEIGRNG